MIWKLQTSIWSDSVLPRDAFTITPHFSDSGGSDPQGLCDDLAAAISTWAGPLHQVTVKAYDAQGTPPVFPEGSKTLVLGNAPPSPMPREIALCLSFFSERNVPRNRGRLYIPGPLIGTSVDVRPSTAQTDKVAALVPIFTGLGGIDVDWCVYSRSDDTARSVTNWWIDDEWDTVRSRGLRSTGRRQGAVAEQVGGGYAAWEEQLEMPSRAPSDKLSAHFTVAEFAEHTGTAAPAGYLMWAEKLCVTMLEPLRRVYGPVTIVSGWRSTAYNASVGGAPQSYHRRIEGRRGSAVDLRCQRGSPSAWYRFLDERGADGLGLYDSWVHVDNRGVRARW